MSNLISVVTCRHKLAAHLHIMLTKGWARVALGKYSWADVQSYGETLEIRNLIRSDRSTFLLIYLVQLSVGSI